MFSPDDAYSSFAVKDIEAARAFYGDTLGMPARIDQDMGGMLLLEVGNREVLVYPKDDHEPAGFTVLNFGVRDVEAAVDDLASRGVTFERYEQFDHDEKGIARSDDDSFPSGAWFTDPSGNVIAVFEKV
jgi:catechol 2,3-dioxygenase-like lactoylglutathione lyase family enzyme